MKVAKITSFSLRPCGLAVATMVAIGSVTARGEIDLVKASAYFAEAQAVCERDGGRLWGASLYGPMMFVDPETREIVANEADANGNLSAKNSVFAGTLPTKLNVANTAVDWAGKRWTMLVWPLPENERTRARLMAHELWHRVQKDLGLSASNPANAHLDTRDGRYWLQLEWRALSAALAADDAARREAITDALLFRAHRRSLFKNAADEERALEMNEGLAEYTGVAMSEADSESANRRAIAGLDAQIRSATFVRSFAYASGPAYGLLLDSVRPDWRKGLAPRDDLGRMLGAALAIDERTPDAGETADRAKVYDDGSLREKEDAREEARRARSAEYRRRFVEGPVLSLRLRMMNIQFDPGTLEPLDDIGTIYPTIQVSDEWGVIEVSGGALLAADWSWLRVEVDGAFSPEHPKHKNWTLTLHEGWSVVPDERAGCYTQRRE
jgi:hypothetical protein